MPWIKPERRVRFDSFIESLANKMMCHFEEDDLDKGDINYVFYKLGKKIMDFEKRYTHMSDVVDTMNYASMELKRKILDPYEDEKEFQNGEIK